MSANATRAAASSVASEATRPEIAVAPDAAADLTAMTLVAAMIPATRTEGDAMSAIIAAHAVTTDAATAEATRQTAAEVVAAETDPAKTIVAGEVVTEAAHHPTAGIGA